MKIKTIINLDTCDIDEKEVFKVLSAFLRDNFQNYEIEVTGGEKPLKTKFTRKPEIKEIVKKLETKTIHPEAVTKIGNQAVLG